MTERTRLSIHTREQPPFSFPCKKSLSFLRESRAFLGKRVHFPRNFEEGIEQARRRGLRTRSRARSRWTSRAGGAFWERGARILRVGGDWSKGALSNDGARGRKRKAVSSGSFPEQSSTRTTHRWAVLETRETTRVTNRESRTSASLASGQLALARNTRDSSDEERRKRRRTGTSSAGSRSGKTRLGPCGPLEKRKDLRNSSCSFSLFFALFFLSSFSPFFSLIFFFPFRLLLLLLLLLFLSLFSPRRCGASRARLGPRSPATRPSRWKKERKKERERRKKQ